MPTLAQLNARGGQVQVPNTGALGGSLAIAIAQALVLIQQMIDRRELGKDREIERERHKLELELLRATKDSEIKAVGKKVDLLSEQVIQVREANALNEQTRGAQVRTIEAGAVNTELQAEGQGIANQRGEIGRTVDQFQAQQQFAALEAEAPNAAAASAFVQLQDLKAAAKQAAIYMGPDGVRRFREALEQHRVAPTGTAPPVDNRFIDIILASQTPDEQERQAALNEASAPVVREFNDLLAVYRRSTQARDEVLARAGRTPPDRQTFEEQQLFVAEAFNPGSVHPDFRKSFERTQEIVAETAIQRSEREGIDAAQQRQTDQELLDFVAPTAPQQQAPSAAPGNVQAQHAVAGGPPASDRLAAPSSPAEQQLLQALMGPVASESDQLAQLQQQAGASQQIQQPDQAQQQPTQAPSREQEFKDELLKQLLMKIGLESMMKQSTLGGGGPFPPGGPQVGL